MEFIEDLFIMILVFILGLFMSPAESTETSPLPDPQEAEVIRVIDGDTIIVSLEGREERIRYIGIDTPELAREGKEAECYGEEAKARNQVLLEGGMVVLTPDKENTDKYNRLLRYVYVDGVSINETLVAEGYATTLYIAPNTSNHILFEEKEDEAKEEKRGLWGSCK